LQNYDGDAMEEDEAHVHEDEDGNRVEIRDGVPEGQPHVRITTRYMTKYERARILGTRALQIRYDTANLVSADQVSCAAQSPHQKLFGLCFVAFLLDGVVFGCFPDMCGFLDARTRCS
jgi:hypothetical protein